MNEVSIAMRPPSLLEIELGLAESTKLPRRQVEVCARILQGLSREEISNDLGIGRATVQTHRMRAFIRLGVASERELGDWYARARTVYCMR